jgi:hypothetical protein
MRTISNRNFRYGTRKVISLLLITVFITGDLTTPLFNHSYFNLRHNRISALRAGASSQTIFAKRKNPFLDTRREPGTEERFDSGSGPGTTFHGCRSISPNLKKPWIITVATFLAILLGIPGISLAHQFLHIGGMKLQAIPEIWTYKNQVENTLSGIAEDILKAKGGDYNYSDIQKGINAILEANPHIDNPELIYPGEKINIPEVILGNSPSEAGEVITRLTGEPLVEIQPPLAEVPIELPAEPIGYSEGFSLLNLITQWAGNNEIFLAFAGGIIVGSFITWLICCYRKQIKVVIISVKIFFCDYGIYGLITTPPIKMAEFADNFIRHFVSDVKDLFSRYQRKYGLAIALGAVLIFGLWEVTEHYFFPLFIAKKIHPLAGMILAIGVTEISLFTIFSYRYTRDQWYRIKFRGAREDFETIIYNYDYINRGMDGLFNAICKLAKKSRIDGVDKLLNFIRENYVLKKDEHTNKWFIFPKNNRCAPLSKEEMSDLIQQLSQIIISGRPPFDKFSNSQREFLVNDITPFILLSIFKKFEPISTLKNKTSEPIISGAAPPPNPDPRKIISIPSAMPPIFSQNCFEAIDSQA